MKKIHARQLSDPKNIHALAYKKSLYRGNVRKIRFTSPQSPRSPQVHRVQ